MNATNTLGDGRVRGDRSTVYDMRAIYSKSDVEEKRSVFAKILRTAYHRLIEQGEIQVRVLLVSKKRLSIFLDNTVLF